MAQRKLRRTRQTFMSDALPRPQGQLKAWLQVDERNGSEFELSAYDPLSRQTQSIAIKPRARSRSSTPSVRTVMRGFMG